MTTTTDNTPLWQLTIGEFKDLVQQEVEKAVKFAPATTATRETIKGLPKMAERLGISVSTLMLYKSKGQLDGTYSQYGRSIYFDVDKVLTAHNNLKHNK